MRILVVGPRYEDSFADNVAMTLQAMGHDVVAAPFVNHSRHWSLSRRAVRALQERFAGDRPCRGDIELLATANRFRPQMLLCLTVDVHPEILDQLSLRARCTRVLWWGDAPANSQRWGLANPFWDLVYVKDPVAVTKLALIGTKARLLHEAMNPQWHKPVAVDQTEQLLVFGNLYAYRQAVTTRLLDAGVHVALYGSDPPTWTHARIREAYRGEYVARDRKSTVISRSMATLNTFAFAEGQSLNCRAFEIAGAGGLQLVEDRPIVSACFEPGKEILPFSTFDELMAHIDRARKYPREMQEIRASAARRALAEHTYRHRLERILLDISS